MLSNRIQLAYNLSRDKIDKSIKTSFDETSKPLIRINDTRFKIALFLIKEWRDTYKDHIRFFDASIDWVNLQTRLSCAMTQYVHYVYAYRMLYGLSNNILFRKILSFEIHFFRKNGVLDLHNKKIISPLADDLTDDENLFHISPLGHFFQFQILKEMDTIIRNTPPSVLSALQRSKFYDMTIETILTTITDFFTQYNGNPISLDDFREFLDKQNNIRMNDLISIIEQRPFEMF